MYLDLRNLVFLYFNIKYVIQINSVIVVNIVNLVAKHLWTTTKDRVLRQFSQAVTELGNVKLNGYKINVDNKVVP